MSAVRGHITIVDYCVFGFTLLLSACIGFYYRFTGGRQRTTAEYLLGDRKMSILPVSFSLMASFMSAITLLGVPSEMYMYGTQFWVINISYIIGTPICAFIFLPVFYRMRCTSVYEYLERRFNRCVRISASIVFMFQMILYMGIVLYAPALALSAVTGLNKWLSIISVGFVCTFYCTIGGIKAVLWTDVFQSFLMFASMILIIFKGTVDIGGFSEVLQRADYGKRIEFLNTDFDPTTRHSIWSLTFGGIFIYVSIYGVNQTQVQRLLTVKSLKHSQISLFLSWIITSLLSLVTCFTGLVIYANYWKCDPLLNKEISNRDQLVPYFVMQSLSQYPGVTGLFIAGIFSGSLSTVSSFVNSLAAVTLEDFVKPFCLRGRYISEKSRARISKILALIFGVICILLTYAAEQMTGLLQASLIIFGIVGGPLLMLFTVGMFCRCCNSIGAFFGFLLSLLIGFWIGFGAIVYVSPPTSLERSIEGCPINTTLISHSMIAINSTISSTIASAVALESDFFQYLYRISYMWYCALLWFIGVLIALIISLLTGCNRNREIDDNLFISFVCSKRSSTDVLNSGKLMHLKTQNQSTKL